MALEANSCINERKNSKRGFVHLRVKTEYSHYANHESLIKPEELVHRTKELGMSSVAVTDRWTMAAIPAFCKAAKEAHIKPIVGLEVDVAFSEEPATKYHRGTLTLLVKNAQGYRNLCRVLARFEPKHAQNDKAIPIEELAQSGFCTGLIGISGAGDGIIARLLEQGYKEEAKVAVRTLACAFDKTDFYLGIGTSAIGDLVHVEATQKANAEAAALADELGLIHKIFGCRIVAADSVQHFERDDYYVLDAWSHSGSRPVIPEGDMHYFRNPDEAHIDFFEYPEAIEHAFDISTKCNFTFEPINPTILRSPLIAEGETAKEALRRLCDLPDIAIDIEERSKNSAIEHIDQTCGTESNANVECYFKMEARSALLETCKSVGLSSDDTENLLSALDAASGSPFARLSEALTSSPVLRQMWNENWRVRHAFDLAQSFEGLVYLKGMPLLDSIH